MRVRDSSAEFTSKYGFSVVAPISVTIPSSTAGSNASCWALLKRWISSRKKIVRRPPEASRSRARSITPRTSARPAWTALSSSNAASDASAIRRASVVLPLPGGPCRIIEWGLPSSIARRSDDPGANSRSWPTNSSSVCGRIRVARGAPGTVAERLRAGASSSPNKRSMSQVCDGRRSTLESMPLQNRVTPLGELIATPERGLVYANRGCLHDAAGRIGDRYPTRRWIACRLEFNGRRRDPKMMPGRFTELFFLDEATALAAGHRPCGECRYADYQQLTTMWAELHPGQHGADAIDEQLDRERRDPRTKQRRFHERGFRRAPRRHVRAPPGRAPPAARLGAAPLVPGGVHGPCQPPGRRNRDRDRDHATVAGGAAPHQPDAARPARARVSNRRLRSTSRQPDLT